MRKPTRFARERLPAASVAEIAARCPPGRSARLPTLPLNATLRAPDRMFRRTSVPDLT
jgi:hypothetical protein